LRNFGLKSGGTNTEGERGAVGFRDEGRMRRKYPLLIRLSDLGERRELSQQGPLLSPAENGFKVIYLRSSPLLTAGDSKFFIFSS